MKLNCKKNSTRNLLIRYTLLFSVFLLSFPLQGQPSALHDTIKINEVVIKGPKSVPVLTGYKTTELDTSVLVEYSNKNLTEVLSENTNIFIRSYGTGGIASLSLRGTGANQTIIDWNGIRISSPMLGQTDISLIPVGMIDNVQIYYGGASMKMENGGTGGIINLETKPVWNKETLVSLNSSGGSFGDYSGLIKVRTGNSQFQSVTKAYFRSVENNFRYLTSEGVESAWVTRRNAQFTNRGFSQEVYYKTHENVLSARVWYQSSNRNLPPTKWEKQTDESLRVMLSDNITKGSNSYYITIAGLLERLNYKFIGIDSRNLSETMVIKAGTKRRIGEHTKLYISINNELSVVNSNNYLKKPNHDVASLTVSMEKTCADRVGMTVLLRETLNNYEFLLPDFSAGFQFRVLDNKEYFLKTNISRNSRIPTMNDLYWPSIGNPDLKNEYAIVYELTGEMEQRLSSSFLLKSNISVYRNTIKDMIQWAPGPNQIWTVYNQSRVNSTGAETGISLAYSLNKFSAKLNAGYTFTKSITKTSPLSDAGSIGKQLIYIPVNQANGSIRFSIGNLYYSWVTVFSGKRFTAADNSHALPYYIINNAVIGFRLPMNNNSIDVNLNINNLFGYNYQSVLNYPMPGQSYMVKALFQFIK